MNHFQPIVEDEVDPILQVRRYEEEQARKQIEREAMELDEDDQSDIAEPEQETQEYDPDVEEGSQGTEKKASESESEEQGSASEASEGDHMEVDDADTAVEDTGEDQVPTLATNDLPIAMATANGRITRPFQEEVKERAPAIQDDDEIIPDSQLPATKDQTRFLSEQEDSTVTSPSSE